MAEEKNQKPVSTPEQPDLEAHSDDNKIENNETSEKITRYKKQAARSFVLAFTTLIAIIAICIAWFVSNTKVTMTGTSISAENTVPYELASAGVRQNPEPTKMPGKLSKGRQETYNIYYEFSDYTTGETKEVKTSKALHVGTSSLAWYLSGQQNFYPGASGQLEFYFIPKQAGLKKITFQLNLIGYEEKNSSLAKVEDSVWEKLINGHILIFKNPDSTNGYSGWLGTQRKLEIASGNSPFTKDVPYKVTLYWKWPKNFRNYVYNDRVRESDLFADVGSDDYKSLQTFVQGQVPVMTEYGKSNKSQLFYATEAYDTAMGNMKDKINNQMEEGDLEICSNYYNLADEYIGKKAEYIYVEIDIK